MRQETRKKRSLFYVYYVYTTRAIVPLYYKNFHFILNWWPGMTVEGSVFLSYSLLILYPTRSGIQRDYGSVWVMLRQP